MTKRVKLADVLWKAANELLSSTDGDAASCCVAYRAEHGASWFMKHGTWGQAVKVSKAVQFLRSLGCPVGSSYALDKFKDKEQRQGVRYMWLLLAMHVAEDENIWIEVSA